MAAVTPQKRQHLIASSPPAASVVEAATSQSRWGVMCKRRTAQYDWEAKEIRLNKVEILCNLTN
jgi:hypothetical protein